MKMITTILILLITLRLYAPADDRTVIVSQDPIKPYQQLIHAVGIVESELDTMAYNPLEEATGYFQIRPIRLRDYNKRTGSHYVIKDMYDYYISEKIFLYYADMVGPYDFEKIAKDWNGSGPKTAVYWRKIIIFLD